MAQFLPDSTRRFSNRVDDYVRYRPGYPHSIIALLEKEAGLTASSVIADIGSGTGISTELFLKHGNTVYAVEPNDEMRKAAESLLQKYAQFHSVVGTAEATTLEDQSIAFIVSAQAFHWFDPMETKREFRRILRPDGWIVLMWNTRRTSSTPFHAAYEALVQQYGTDYQLVKHVNINEDALRAFLGAYQKRVLFNEQVLDFEGLKGRLLSSSYTPREGDPRYKPMLEQLARIFNQYEENGHVRIEYETEIYFSRVSHAGNWA